MKRRRLSVRVLCLLLVFALFNPLAAKISRASSRVIQEPGDLITTRKANFKLGDILGVPLVSMTITNNAEVGYLLLSLELTIDASSGSLTADDKLVAVIVRKFESNEVFKFTNEDLLDYIGDIRFEDTSIDQDMLDVFGMSSLSMDSLESYLKSGKKLPEGVYTMTLTAADITPDDPDNLTTTTYTTGTTYTSDSVDFKVITIGALNITQVPTADDKTLAFEVPQIPYYSDTSIPTASTTRVTITGPGIIRPVTLIRDHTRVTSSAGSALKGYPGDLEDGIDTFDLSGVKFRAGERYDFEIEYIDSSGYPIADLTTEISFPEPRFSAEVDRTRPFNPEFSWGFNDDYSSWAKEYRVYLNNRYVGYTSGNTYTVSSSLNPGTYYSWHVMPVNRDGSAFFEEVPRSAGGAFTTQAHTSLEIEISSPADNATLIAGNTYDFSARPTLSDDADLEKVIWVFPEGRRFGTDISYTPTRRFPEGSLKPYTIAEDSFHLKKSSTRVNLTVLDPAIAISGPNTIPAGVPVTFTLDSAATRDLDSVEWFEGASSIGTGSSLTYTFKENRTYSLTARGTTRPDMYGDTKTVTSADHVVEVTDIIDGIPVIAGGDEREVFSGASITFSLAAGRSYDPSTVEWFAEGTRIGTGDSISYSFTANGTYSVTAKGTTASGSIVTSRPQRVKVTTPPDSFIISGGASREVVKGESVTFALEPTGTYDLRSVDWVANDTLMGTGKTISYAFWEIGTYSVTANGITKAFGRIVTSHPQKVTVVDRPHGAEQAGTGNLFGVGESIKTEVPPMYPPDFGMNGEPPDFVVTEAMERFLVGPFGTSTIH